MMNVFSELVVAGMSAEDQLIQRKHEVEISLQGVKLCWTHDCSHYCSDEQECGALHANTHRNLSHFQ